MHSLELQVFQGWRWLGEEVVLKLELGEQCEGKEEEQEEQEGAQSLELLVCLHLLSSGGLEHLCTQEKRYMTNSKRLLWIK